MGVRTDGVSIMLRCHQRRVVQPCEGHQPAGRSLVAIRTALMILTTLSIVAPTTTAAGRISPLRPRLKQANFSAPDSDNATNDVALTENVDVKVDAVVDGKTKDDSPFVAEPTADKGTCCPDFSPWHRSDDSIYLVNTRCLACPCGKVVPLLPVQRYDDDTGTWQSSSVEELRDDCDDGGNMSIHVHGNRIDGPEAIARGWAVYHEWVSRDPGAEPLVFVIWSWPSSQIKGQLKDVRTKAARTEAESFFLAHLLAEMPAATRVSLSGHSFGARIICGAAHLLTGDSLWGYRLDRPVQEPRRLRAILTAAAMHNYWLSEGCHHGEALTQFERILVLYNSSDPALRFYRHIEKRSRPAALGYTGAVFCGDSRGLADRVDQMNVACYIGREHSFVSYLCCPALTDMAAPYALFLPLR